MSSSQPESSAPVPYLPLSQDSPSGTTALDLNKHAMDSAQDHWQDQDFYFPAFWSFNIISSLVHFIIYIYVYVSVFKFQFIVFILVDSLYKAWLNSAFILSSGWYLILEFNVCWLVWSDRLRGLSELECVNHMFWMSVQWLEEKEHGIRIMTENVSWFIRLIVKESISLNPVRVWSLIVRERLTLSNDFCMNLWVWNECVKLKMMKTMFWLKTTT